VNWPTNLYVYCNALKVPGELGSYGRTIADDHEPSVVGEQLLALAAASIPDTAGSAFDALDGDLFGKPLPVYQQRSERQVMNSDPLFIRCSL
jgi:hypothetical protein